MRFALFSLILLAVFFLITCSNPLSSSTFECRGSVEICDNMFSCAEVTTFHGTGVGETEDAAEQKMVEDICRKMDAAGLLTRSTRKIIQCYNEILLSSKGYSLDCKKR